jgi:hypothetical protein
MGWACDGGALGTGVLSGTLGRAARAPPSIHRPQLREFPLDTAVAAVPLVA